MIKWAVESSEFGINYEPMTTLKSQILIDFMAELTPPTRAQPHTTWKLHVDGLSNSKGSGAGLILENDDRLVVEVSLTFSFATSPN